MSRIYWKKSFSVQSHYIDLQHQHLLSIVNNFNKAVEKGKGLSTAYAILNRLIHYAEEHFRDEEKLMEIARFPIAERNAHIEEHEKLTEAIFSHCENWSNYGEEALPQIGTFLIDWLMEHILTTDMKYSKYVANIDDKFLSVK